MAHNLMSSLMFRNKSISSPLWRSYYEGLAIGHVGHALSGYFTRPRLGQLADDEGLLEGSYRTHAAAYSLHDLSKDLGVGLFDTCDREDQPVSWTTEKQVSEIS